MNSKRLSKKIAAANKPKHLIVTYRISLTATPEFSEGNFVLDEKSRVQTKYIQPIYCALSKMLKTGEVQVVACLPYVNFRIWDDQQYIFDGSNVVLAPDLKRIEEELDKNARQSIPCNPKQAVSNIRAFDIAKHFCKMILNPQIIEGDNLYDAPHIPQDIFLYSPEGQSQDVISNSIRITGFNIYLIANLHTLVAISANKDYEIIIDGKNKVAFLFALRRLIREKDVYLSGGIIFDKMSGKWMMSQNAYFN